MKPERQPLPPLQIPQDSPAPVAAFASFFHSGTHACLDLDRHGVIRHAAPGAERLLGSAPLVGLAFDSLIKPADRQGFAEFRNSLLSGCENLSILLRLSNSPASLLPGACHGLNSLPCDPADCPTGDAGIRAECRGHLQRHGNAETHIALCLIDITADREAQLSARCLNEKLEQKLIQQTRQLTKSNQDLQQKIEQLKFYKNQIREREAMLNAIFNHLSEGMLTVNPSGRIVHANQAAENLFGYAKAELTELNILELIDLTTDSARPKRIKQLLGRYKRRAKQTIPEINGKHRNGALIPLDLTLAEFTLNGGDYITCIVRDLTERKRREQLDQQHLDELSHVARLALMGELVSGIAHEVNQPLSAIASYSQACINILRKPPVDQAKLAEILHKTNHYALTAGQIIHRMRDFVKTKKMRCSTVDAGDLIQDAIGLCQHAIKQESIALKLQLEKKSARLCVDRIQIEQVILNLIKNGIDALTALPKGIPRQLSIQCLTLPDRQLEIRIKDNGPGIETAEQIRILTPFYTTKAEGMGMGLSICRSIIEAHDGVLRFNSLPGKGSTFYFTLPIPEQSLEI